MALKWKENRRVSRQFLIIRLFNTNVYFIAKCCQWNKDKANFINLFATNRKRNDDWTILIFDYMY